MIGFVGILIGMFAIGMMQLILAASLPFVAAEIGGDSMYSWVFSSYMLSSLATIPLFSKFADIYGRKRFFILGMSIFALGSLYGGFAQSMPHLIGARVIQGFSAGIITPVSLAIVSDIFPSEKRGNMIGIFGFVQLLSNLLSPPLGSFLTKQLSWRWIFFLVIVLVILSVILFLFYETHEERRSSMKPSEIDIAGGMIFGGICVLTVSFSNVVSKQGELDITGMLILLAAVILTIILIFIEKKHKNPVIKMEFLKVSLIRSSIISSLLTGAIMYGLVTVLPLCGVILTKQGLGIDESKLLLIFMVGITSGLLLSSRLKGRVSSSNFSRFLWGAMCASSILIIHSINSVSLLIFYVLIVCVGLCTGGIMATFLIDSQNAVASEDRAVLSGLVQLGRYFGASLGVTILTGVLPEAGMITNIGQFLVAFGLLTALSLAGLVNSFLYKSPKPISSS